MASRLIWPLAATQKKQVKTYEKVLGAARQHLPESEAVAYTEGMMFATLLARALMWIVMPVVFALGLGLGAWLL